MASLSSLANSPTQGNKTSPELRRQSEIVAESGGAADRAINAKSCPDLETMVTAGQGLKIPVAKEAAGTGEILLSKYFYDNHKIFSGERDCGSPGPVSRHRNRHRHTKSDHHLPKFSISLEEAEAWAVQAGLSELGLGAQGPASLPATQPAHGEH